MKKNGLFKSYEPGYTSVFMRVERLTQDSIDQ